MEYVLIVVLDHSKEHVLLMKKIRGPYPDSDRIRELNDGEIEAGNAKIDRHIRKR